MPSDKANVQPRFQAHMTCHNPDEYGLACLGRILDVRLPDEQSARALAEALNNAEANAERCKVLEAALVKAEVSLRISERLFITYTEMLHSYLDSGVSHESAIEKLRPWTKEQCAKFNAAQAEIVAALKESPNV